MRRLFLALLIGLNLLLSACASPAASQAPAAASPLPPSATPLPTLAPASPTPTLIATAAPTASPTPAESATPSRTPPPPAEAVLAEIIAGPDWAGLGLPPERTAAWRAYAAGKGKLDRDEVRRLNDFVSQWRELQALADGPHLPKAFAVAYRTLESEDDQGNLRTQLYPVTADGTPLLVARTASGKAVGLALPPPLDGFDLRISPDGRSVQYVDAHPGSAAGVTRLSVDAIALDETDDETLLKALSFNYAKNSTYMKEHIFPRFFFPAPQVGTAFYCLEKTLSYQQIVHMNEAFELFDRVELQPLKLALFPSGTSIVVIENLQTALGVTFTGSKVMAISRKNLLGNRYEVAEVLAHEGAHVLQGDLPKSGDKCAALLRMEVADKTIPDGFAKLSAQQILDLVRQRKIGSYHVSLWTFNQLGGGGAMTAWLTRVIHTGTADGQPIVTCKK